MDRNTHNIYICVWNLFCPLLFGVSRNPSNRRRPSPKTFQSKPRVLSKASTNFRKVSGCEPFRHKRFGIGGFHHPNEEFLHVLTALWKTSLLFAVKVTNPSGESMQYRGDVLVTGPVLGSSQWLCLALATHVVTSLHSGQAPKGCTKWPY